MSRLQESAGGLKRKRPEPNGGGPDLPADKVVLDLIRRKGDMGIFKGDLKKEAKLTDPAVNKVLKALLANNLIKEVVNMKSKGRKHYMASEFEPAKELTGGEWYVDGKLDKEFIDELKKLCKKVVQKMKVATAEGVAKFMKTNKVAKIESARQIEEILKSLVLDNEIIEVKSTGLGEYHEIPLGSVCYRSATAVGLGQGPKTSALASIPCGVCPRISQCTPDGIISPKTCEYYKKWLSF